MIPPPPRFASALAFLGACVALTAGCGATPEDRAEAKWGDLRSRALRDVRHATCSDGATLGPNCGLVVERVAQRDFRDRFREQRCAGKDPATCDALLSSAVDTWLEQRYFAADWTGVARACEEHPGSCDAPSSYELLLLQSHDHFLRADTTRAADELESDRRAVAEENAVIGRGVLSAAALLLARPHCHACRTRRAVSTGR